MESSERLKMKFWAFASYKCETINSPLSLTQFTKDFHDAIQTEETIDCLKSRIIKWRLDGDSLCDIFEFKTPEKVRIMFGLGVPVPPDYLIELQKNAFVEVDKEQRITVYVANDESLKLQGNHVEIRARDKKIRVRLGNPEETSESRNADGSGPSTSGGKRRPGRPPKRKIQEELMIIMDTDDGPDGNPRHPVVQQEYLTPKVEEEDEVFGEKTTDTFELSPYKSNLAPMDTYGHFDYSENEPRVNIDPLGSHGFAENLNPVPINEWAPMSNGDHGFPVTTRESVPRGNENDSRRFVDHFNKSPIAPIQNQLGSNSAPSDLNGYRPRGDLLNFVWDNIGKGMYSSRVVSSSNTGSNGARMGNTVATEVPIKNTAASKPAPLNRTVVIKDSTRRKKHAHSVPSYKHASVNFNRSGAPSNMAQPRGIPLPLSHVEHQIPQEDDIKMDISEVQFLYASQRDTTSDNSKRAPMEKLAQPVSQRKESGARSESSEIGSPQLPRHISSKTVLNQLRGLVIYLDSPLLNGFQKKIEEASSRFGHGDKKIPVRLILAILRALLFNVINFAKASENRRENFSGFLMILWNNMISFDIPELEEFGEEVKREVDKTGRDQKTVAVDSIQQLLEAIFYLASP